MGGLGKNIYELEEYKEPENINIMIVDSLNLAFRYKHAKVKEFAESYLKTVKSLAKSYKSEKVIIACDYGKSKYREELYPAYKEDRKLKVEAQTEEEKEEFEEFFSEFNNTIKLCEKYYPVLKYKGVEADDIAAYLTHYLLKDFENHIWLISSDKDWDLLITPNTSRFSYVTRKEYKLDNWNEYHEFPFEHALDIKILVGGKDNVQGIPGIGPKRAADLVGIYGSVFDIYSELPIPGKSQYIQNLNENGERLLLNSELIDKITYCKDAIGCDNLVDINNKVNNYVINSSYR
jgi:5'-3' exonuclease